MRKIVLASLASIALAASVALAADDVMASRYGNTTVTTDAKGQQTKVWYKADGTFTAKAGDQTTTGTWKVDGGKICLTYTGATPPGMTSPACFPISAHKVGDKWTVGEGDNKRTVELVAGEK
jgi:hypothetical protein